MFSAEYKNNFMHGLFFGVLDLTNVFADWLKKKNFRSHDQVQGKNSAIEIKRNSDLS